MHPLSCLALGIIYVNLEAHLASGQKSLWQAGSLESAFQTGSAFCCPCALKGNGVRRRSSRTVQLRHLRRPHGRANNVPRLDDSPAHDLSDCQSVHILLLSRPYFSQGWFVAADPSARQDSKSNPVPSIAILLLAPLIMQQECVRLWIKTNAQSGGIPRCPGGCMQKAR